MPYTKIRISLCGNKKIDNLTSQEIKTIFKAHEITHESFWNQSGSILGKEELIFLIGEKYMGWENAAPIIVSLCAFGKSGEFQNLEGVKGVSVKGYSNYFRSWWNKSLDSELKDTKPYLKVKDQEVKHESPIIKNETMEPSNQLTVFQLSPKKHRKEINYVKSVRLTSDQLVNLIIKY